jgi:hypothetical protein
MVRGFSLEFEHGVSDDVVAELVDGDDQVIVVSGQQVVVDSVVEITHVHHVLQVSNQVGVLEV